MASVRASVLHRIGRMSFTLHSKGVVYPSGKWLSSSEIHLHTSTISTACTVLHTQAMQCILHGKTVLNNARPPWTVILFIGKKSNEYVCHCKVHVRSNVWELRKNFNVIDSQNYATVPSLVILSATVSSSLPSCTKCFLSTSMRGLPSSSYTSLSVSSEAEKPRSHSGIAYNWQT